MRNLRSHPTQRRDHYQELTDRIIAALEAGVAPWRRPWDPNACGGSNMPVNVATGHRYRGVNLFVLGMSPLTFTGSDWFLVQIPPTAASSERGAVQRRRGHTWLA
jgi:antirestriction protein ArdC